MKEENRLKLLMFVDKRCGFDYLDTTCMLLILMLSCVLYNLNIIDDIQLFFLVIIPIIFLSVSLVLVIYALFGKNLMHEIIEAKYFQYKYLIEHGKKEK